MAHGAGGFNEEQVALPQRAAKEFAVIDQRRSRAPADPAPGEGVSTAGVTDEYDHGLRLHGLEHRGEQAGQVQARRRDVLLDVARRADALPGVILAWRLEVVDPVVLRDLLVGGPRHGATGPRRDANYMRPGHNSGGGVQEPLDVLRC